MSGRKIAEVGTGRSLSHQLCDFREVIWSLQASVSTAVKHGLILLSYIDVRIKWANKYKALYKCISIKHQGWSIKSCHPLITSVIGEKKRGLNLAGTKLQVWCQFFPPTPYLQRVFFHCWDSLELGPITCVDMSLDQVISTWLQGLGAQQQLQGLPGCGQCRQNPSFPALGTDVPGRGCYWALLTLLLKVKTEVFVTWVFKWACCTGVQSFLHCLLTLSTWPYL